jgi:hypothetical protein
MNEKLNVPFKEIEEKISEIEKENAPLKAKIDLKVTFLIVIFCNLATILLFFLKIHMKTKIPGRFFQAGLFVEAMECFKMFFVNENKLDKKYLIRYLVLGLFSLTTTLISISTLH